MYVFLYIMNLFLIVCFVKSLLEVTFRIATVYVQYIYVHLHLFIPKSNEVVEGMAIFKRPSSIMRGNHFTWSF
jgi:hypothetical protein